MEAQENPPDKETYNEEQEPLEAQERYDPPLLSSSSDECREDNSWSGSHLTDKAAKLNGALKAGYWEIHRSNRPRKAPDRLH